MPQGICSEVYLIDGAGKPKATPATPKQADGATSLYFGIDTTITVHPKEQLELKREIESALQAINAVFLDQKRVPKSDRYGEYLEAIKKVSHLGLVGATALPDVAAHALTGIVNALVDAEGPAVKDRRLKTLAYLALLLSSPFAIAYAVLRIGADIGLFGSLPRILAVYPLILSSFCAMWIGCFVGVVLSYGIRKSTITLADFVRADADRLMPGTRLIFAGTLTMLIGIMLLLGMLEIKIGSFTTGDLGSYPMAAFLIGSICGISELSLPSAVSERVGKMFKSTLG